MFAIYSSMSRALDDMVIITSPQAEAFARSMYGALLKKAGKGYDGIPFSTISVEPFNNGEIGVQIPQNLRKRDVYVVHTFSNGGVYEPNTSLMELYLIDDAVRRASATEITYVLPHIPYQRQDMKDKPRVPISARRVMDMLILYSNPPTRIVTFDMHAGQIQGFSQCPVDNLEALPLFLEHFKSDGFPPDITVVSPDAGGVKRARAMAHKMGAGLAIIDKRRLPRDEAEPMGLLGEVTPTAIIVDDMVDSGGTLLKGASLLREHGAKEIYACCTHAILSPSNGTTAEEKFANSGIRLVATDTVPRSDAYLEANKSWLTMLSVADMAGDAIHRIQTGASVSELFRGY